MADFGELANIEDPATKHWPSNGQSVEDTRNLFALAYGSAMAAGSLRSPSCLRETGMIRPGTAGSQRLACATTSDSTPTYASFRRHFRALLNLSNSGFSCTGFDAGGWDAKGPDDVYARWFAAAAFNPYFWAHGQGAHEPYAHGAQVESAAREFLKLRYRLLPYFYSQMEESHRTGVPILRPFDLEEPDFTLRSGRRLAREIDDQVFVGHNILVAPLFNRRGRRRVRLPAGTWYDLFDENKPLRGPLEVRVDGVALNRVPAFVRAGAIVPMGPEMQYAEERAVDPLTVHYYAHPERGDFESLYSLFEDDGLSAADSGIFQRTHFAFKQSAEKIEVAIEVERHAFEALRERKYVLELHGAAAFSHASLNGHELIFEKNRGNWIVRLGALPEGKAVVEFW